MVFVIGGSKTLYNYWWRWNCSSMLHYIPHLKLRRNCRIFWCKLGKKCQGNIQNIVSGCDGQTIGKQNIVFWLCNYESEATSFKRSDRSRLPAASNADGNLEEWRILSWETEGSQLVSGTEKTLRKWAVLVQNIPGNN